ncbi:MAG: tRNA preQ1(34) S-adenosylmethionine ribosyltransferase-isomerase QueA [Actinobacteria bacterium]|nr:tRNA preQ1(34) S-adenosylmethionine ribosyltransferase-isomerase QueA [Actinomycetota bacterium]
MRTSDLDYDLPEAAIAQVPAEPRDSARLLVDTGGADPLDATVADLGRFLSPGDVMVVNRTRVRKARLLLRRATGARVEVLLLDSADGEVFDALLGNSRRVADGEVLEGRDGEPVVEVLGRGDGTARVRLIGGEDALDRHGEVPLPPYITERIGDPERYQTVFARDARSAAAPTAGLHLTDRLLDSLRASGVAIHEVELVVGLDTFRPIAGDDPLRHEIHSEWYSVPQSTADACAAARASGGRVLAVGTTSVRALESAAASGRLQDRTSLYIVPGHEWRTVDLMMTNFHMPRTTLLAMVQAFVGPSWRGLYSTALERGYRFLSFGDAMLLRRGPVR